MCRLRPLVLRGLSFMALLQVALALPVLPLAVRSKLQLCTVSASTEVLGGFFQMKPQNSQKSGNFNIRCQLPLEVTAAAAATTTGRGVHCFHRVAFPLSNINQSTRLQYRCVDSAASSSSID